jgi:hypothetical protein
MPIDVLDQLTPSDLKLISRARKRNEKAARKLIERISDRAAKTTRVKQTKIEREIEDPIDRVWPPSFLRGKRK